MRQWFGFLIAFLFVWFMPPAGEAAPFDPFTAVGIDSGPGTRVPLDVPFQDEAGRTTSLRNIGGGRPIVLAPVLHTCHNICGVTLGGLGDAVASQPRNPDFVVVAFSIDPNETPTDAAASLAALEARWTGGELRNVHALTGTAEAVSAITHALGYRYVYDSDIRQYAHAAAVAVLTTDGRLVRWIYGLAPDPDELGAAIGSAENNRIGSIGERLILLCYHYDPHTGRYTLLIDRLMQIAGSATALVLAALIVLASRRERVKRRGEP